MAALDDEAALGVDALRISAAPASAAARRRSSAAASAAPEWKKSVSETNPSARPAVMHRPTRSAAGTCEGRGRIQHLGVS